MCALTQQIYNTWPIILSTACNGCVLSTTKTNIHENGKCCSRHYSNTGKRHRDNDSEPGYSSFYHLRGVVLVVVAVDFLACSSVFSLKAIDKLFVLLFVFVAYIVSALKYVKGYIYIKSFSLCCFRCGYCYQPFMQQNSCYY